MEPLLKKLRLQRLRPPPEVTGLSWTQQQMFVESQGQRKRKVYFNTPYDQQEKQQIQQVKRRLVGVGLTGVFEDAVILKHIYAGKNSFEKTVERLVDAYAFLSNPQMARYTYQTEEDLQKGFAYTFGYSRNFRPVVYIRPDLIDFSNDNYYNSIYVLFYVCQRYRMVPYYCEKLHLVIDLNHMWVSEIPITKIYDILQKINVGYCENAEKIFVLNASGLGTIWFFVKRLMREEARKRVVFPEKMSDLDQFISPDQREEKYGGTLPNLTLYWYNVCQERPPTPTYLHPLGTPSSKSEIELAPDSKRSVNESFYSVVNNPGFFGMTEQDEVVSRCRCQCCLF